MAQITYHSERGEKSALVMYKENPFQFGGQPVYIPRSAWNGAKQGDTMDVPAMHLVPMTDEEGNARTSKDGAVLMQFGGTK